MKKKIVIMCGRILGAFIVIYRKKVKNALKKEFKKYAICVILIVYNVVPNGGRES